MNRIFCVPINLQRENSLPAQVRSMAEGPCTLDMGRPQAHTQNEAYAAHAQ